MSIKKILDSFPENKRGDLIEKLKKRSITEGDIKFDQRYKLHESRVYTIDNSFPKILLSEIRNLQYGSYITKFSYSLNLSGLSYISIEDLQQKPNPRPKTSS